MTDVTGYKFLPLTLSMETMGGIAVPMMRRGTPLPAKRKQRFTTAADNQKTVKGSIFLGESPISGKNISVGSFELTDIPEAPREEVEFNVEFEVNNKCQIKTKVFAMKSGKMISSAEYEYEPPLTNEKINAMLRKAIDEQQEDQSAAENIEAKNSANSLLHRAEKYLQSQQVYGLHSSVDVQIEETIADLGLALQDDNIGAIKDKTKRLKELIPATDSGFGALFGADAAFNSFFGIGQTQNKKPEKTRSTETARASIEGSSSTSGIAKSKEGVFSAGQYFDAKRTVRDLFASAMREIIIIDAYIGEDVLNILTVKRDGVHVKLLAGKVSPVVLTLARDFNRQYKNLEIRSSKIFHDRFIFIDDRDFYHFGASLEHLGNKTFMFSKLEEPLIIATLRTHWASGWDQATFVL
jgi:hypothetical protein